MFKENGEMELAVTSSVFLNAIIVNPMNLTHFARLIYFQTYDRKIPSDIPVSL